MAKLTRAGPAETTIAGLKPGPVGCSGSSNLGCSPPVGEKWDRWDMAGSTYAYCYDIGCAVDWFYNNTDKFGLNKYGGVVSVDHYWTHQVRQREILHSI